MNKNALLKIAVFLCKLAKVFTGLIFLAVTVLFIHFQIDRSAYEGWNIKNPGSSSTVQFMEANGTTNDSDSVYPVESLSFASLYFGYLKFAGILLLVFFSIHQFQKVMQSVKNLQTFRDLNVRSFRRIGMSFILIFCLDTFSYWEFGNHTAQTISINTTPLLIALVAFIFAEIFKEGNLLMEENKLTV